MASSPPIRAFGRAPCRGSLGMLQDIWETPRVLESILEKHLAASNDRVLLPSLEKPLTQPQGLEGKTALEVMGKCSTSAGGNFANKFVIVGCGTSFNAALLAEYLIETIARIPVEVQYASEFRYRTPVMRKGDVFVIISNSGETFDSIECMKAIRNSENGSEILVMSVVNNLDSTLGREADAVFHAPAGSEIGVAATKAFSATALGLVLLALSLGKACKTIEGSEWDMLISKLRELPKQVEAVLEKESSSLHRNLSTRPAIGECALWDMSCQNALAQNFIFLGRGFNFPIALEGAMKCKEVAYIHAEGYPAAEMKHGPIALIDQFMPVVFIAPRSDPTFEKIKANVEEVKTRHGSIIVITDDTSGELEALCEHLIQVPQTHEYLMPLISVIPLQLLAYMMGLLRGNEIDNPRGLEKSVSKEAMAGKDSGTSFRPEQRT
eukprot:TRINITY_DN6143_c0_g5_i1.p1 TRINITY_DN6143_c0_g5~~TRINITY_DN6143_c0_g5_i1.p1  ORF type:complete len:447 (-),score=103.78 TRINITY_DN6143_c0_g5_i1:265-1578(-)